jgi:hypothetical protein
MMKLLGKRKELRDGYQGKAREQITSIKFVCK